jgi:hypothetical protein
VGEVQGVVVSVFKCIRKDWSALDELFKVFATQFISSIAGTLGDSALGHGDDE